jgi:hypothetical protein
MQRKIKWYWMTRSVQWTDAKLRMGMWLAGRLPARLRYAVVIYEACEYSYEHTEAEVPAITAIDITRRLLGQMS